MGYNLESNNNEINETPEVEIDSEQLSETEETAENFDDCSLNEVQDSKGNEVNAESLKEVEENYDDCEAKMEEMEEEHPELAEEDDDFNDCGKETDGRYVAEVTYTTDGEISEEEVDAELQEAYNECDDPEDMQQLKENANENEHIEVHNAEVVERPENSELSDELTEAEYEEAQEKLDEAQENLEAQQEAAEKYQEDLENEINNHEDTVPEGTENINNESLENTEETESSGEIEETTEEIESSDGLEEETGETESSNEIKETAGDIEDFDEVEENTGDTENSDEVEETEDSEAEDIGTEDLENMEDGSKVEASEIDEEKLSENISQEVEKETDAELSDETKEQIAEEVSDEINSEAENNEISAGETEEKIEEKKVESVKSLNEQSDAIDEEIEQKADDIAEQDDLTEEEAKEQISEEVSGNTRENLSDDEVDAMVEEKSEPIEETIEEKAEEQEAVDSVEETADELENEKTEQFSEQSEQSLQERIEGAFEKEDVTASEINSLRDEHSAELQAKIEEKSTTEAELKTKFDEVLSKEKGTNEYRQSLQEYNALQDKKVELDEQITAMEKQQDLLDKKSIELREAQIRKGSEAMAASAATLAGVNMLQERYDQTYYDAKADKAELVNIRDESCSVIKELSAEKDSIKQAMDAKMDEISEYVTSNNMDRYDTAYDLRYQQMSAEYNAMKESYDRIGYSIVKLDENNKAINERIEAVSESGLESPERLFGNYAVDDRGFVKGDNYDQYIEDWEKYSSDTHQTEIFDEAKTQFISSSSIEGIRVSDYDIDNPSVFWSQHKHDGTEASFEEIARHIPEVESRLYAGEALSELMQDPDIGACATIYFHPDNIPKVIKCGDYYELQENGRHRILAARNLGYDIPVKVIGEMTIKTDIFTDTISTGAIDVFHEKKEINEVVLPKAEVEIKNHITTNNLDKYISKDKMKAKLTNNTKALTPGEMKSKYGDGWSPGIMGFNNGKKSYVDSSYGSKQAKETAIHEYYHQLSANDEKTFFGKVKNYKRGLSIDGNDRGLNEALTQKYTLDTMRDTDPSYTNPACAYDDASKYIDDLYSFENNKDMFDQAYFKNNPDALRQHFDQYCGDGFYDELSRHFDTITDPNHSPSERKKSLDRIDEMVNDYKLNRLLS